MDESVNPLETQSPLLIHARALRVAILDQPQAPAPAAAALVAQARAAGDHAAAAVVLNALAYAHRESLRHDEALVCVSGALDAAHAGAVAEEEVRALVNRAMIRVELGEFDAARADLESARAIGPLDPTLALAGAVLARHAGQVRIAKDLLETVLDETGLAPDVRLKALNNLADVLMESDPERALRLLDEAATLVPATNLLFGPVIDLNRGLALAQAGDLPSALAALRRSEERQRELHGGGHAAEYDLEIAKVLGALRLLSEARAAAARAVQGLVGDGGALIRADALMSAGRLAVADGDRARARELIGEAYQLYAAQDRPAGRAISALEALALDERAAAADAAGHAAALSDLGLLRDAARGWLLAGELADAAGDTAAAQRYWARCAELKGADRLLVLDARARAASAAGDRTGADASVTAALALVDARAALAKAPDLRHRIAADRERFEQLQRHLNRRRRPATRLDAILRGRGPAPGPVPAGGDVADLRLQWRELARRVESPEESPESLIGLGIQLARTERELRTAAWATGSTASSRPPNGLAATAAAAGMPVLAIARIGADAVAFRHDDGSTWARPLGSWADLTQHVARLGRALARIATVGAGPDGAQSATSLASGLQGRFGDLLGGAGPLLMLLDRGLESAALTALPTLWSRPVGFGALAVTRGPVTAPADVAPEVAVAVGPRLRHAEHEADAIAAVWGSATRARTAPALLTALARHDVVHVAAHATLRWDNALQSVIHLDDGPLALTEVADVAADRAGRGSGIRLLYLAACSLASGPTDVALPSAITTLTEHGIEVVIASSIPLPDQHSRWIAEIVHTAVCRGETPAAGLANARARIDPHDPGQAVAWAALSCLGAYTALP